MINILFMVFYVIFNVFGIILFKINADSFKILMINKGTLGLHISFTSLIGMFCYICSFFIYLFLISKNSLSFIVPIMTGIVYVSVLTASMFILKEKITIISLIGSIIILLGVMLVAFQGK